MNRINRSLEQRNRKGSNYHKRYFSRALKNRNPSALIQQNEFEFTEKSSNSSNNTDMQFSKHRSTMKGRHQVPTQFKFFKSKHSLDFSVQNREAKERKKKEIDQIVEELDKQNEILTEDSIQINQEIIEEQVRADTANLETMLYDKLDIRKASC